jgi:hypothetical protein
MERWGRLDPALQKRSLGSPKLNRFGMLTQESSRHRSEGVEKSISMIAVNPAFCHGARSIPSIEAETTSEKKLPQHFRVDTSSPCADKGHLIFRRDSGQQRPQ